MIIERELGPLSLGEADGDPSSCLALRQGCLRVWPVGKAVGNVKNDRPQLLEPSTVAEPTLL